MNTQDIAINRAVTLLKAANAVFEIHYDGKVFGGLPKQESKRKQGAHKHRIPSEHRGKMTNHVRNTLKGMSVGTVAMFDLSDPNISHVNVEQLQASVASVASSTWGLKSYISHRVNDNTAVELLRLA